MNIKFKRSSLFFLCTFCSSVAFAEITHDLGTHGYFRLGTGLSDNNVSQEIFKAPGAGSKYRLGNENDTWIELDAYDTVKLSDKGPYIHTEIMGTFNGAQNKKINFNEIIQLYAEVGDFTSAFGNPKIWIGRRYYDRHDIHINDFFFLNTLQGFDGGGVRDLDLNVGKLALAVGRKNADDYSSTKFDESSISQTRFDARFSDISVRDKGNITLWGTYDSSGSNGNVDGLKGYALGILYTQDDFFGGSNKFMVQYGRGLGRHAGKGGVDAATGTVTSSAVANDFEDAQTFRIVNSNVIAPNENWAMMTALVYENLDSKSYDGTDQDWFSIGVRPVWFINDNFRIPFELGYDKVKDNTANTNGSLVKATLAAEFALERGFWARPVLRVFATHATWSDQFKGQIGGATYTNETSGWSVGIQAEYWR